MLLSTLATVVALFNSKGELIGINTAIIPSFSADGSRGNLGVGFAVPSNHLRDSLANLKAGGVKDIYSSRPRLGIGIYDVRMLPADVRESLEVPERGVVIRSVEPDSPADKAGLKGGSFNVMIGGQEVPVGGDVIIAIDDQAVTTSTQLQDLVFAHQPGDEVKVTISRKGEEQDIIVALEIVPLSQNDSSEESPSQP
ncbi:MAG: PDZ domain-containing protein [Deinococcales bacterium]